MVWVARHSTLSVRSCLVINIRYWPFLASTASTAVPSWAAGLLYWSTQLQTLGSLGSCWKHVVCVTSYSKVASVNGSMCIYCQVQINNNKLVLLSHRDYSSPPPVKPPFPPPPLLSASRSRSSGESLPPPDAAPATVRRPSRTSEPGHPQPPPHQPHRLRGEISKEQGN